MNECSVCREDFGGKVVPAILTCCGEEICYECGENYRVAKISNLTGNRKKIKCLLCNAEFHSINDTPWIVNKPMIKRLNLQVDLSCVREAQAARHLAYSTRNYDAVSRRSQRTSNIDVNKTLPKSPKCQFGHKYGNIYPSITRSDSMGGSPQLPCAARKQSSRGE